MERPKALSHGGHAVTGLLPDVWHPLALWPRHQRRGAAQIRRQGGLDSLRNFKWGTGVSELLKHRDSSEESFKKNPPHTVAEACQRIKDETGIERKPTQVRAFLKKCLA